MSQIKVEKLTYAYDGSYDNIFEDVSFQIDSDWKLGLIGKNGMGKTTLLKLFLGHHEYIGKIISSVQFEYFPFYVKDMSSITIDIIDGICSEVEYWRIRKELSLLECDEDILYRPYGTLSNGERTKVLLSALFSKDNSFLLIDEPTDNLDMHGRDIVSNYLNGKKGFILVSHDRAFLDGCIDHVMSINNTEIQIQQGDYSSWRMNKDRRDSFEIAENERLKKEVKQLQRTVREKAAWSDKAERRKIGFDPTKTEKNINSRPVQGAKAKKMMKRAKAIENRYDKAIEDKSRLLRNVDEIDALKVQQENFHSRILANLKDLSIFYGDKTACSHVSFAVEKGDRIALCGKNGAGKSSILKLICGASLTYNGSFSRGSSLHVSIVQQETASLSGSLSDFAVSRGIEESLFKAILRKLGFSRVQFEKDMENFSSGQKKKVLIAASLCEKSHLMVWDEPLNFIDVNSRVQIEELLLKQKPTVIFVEHDRVFCEKIATKIIEL